MESKNQQNDSLVDVSRIESASKDNRPTVSLGNKCFIIFLMGMLIVFIFLSTTYESKDCLKQQPNNQVNTSPIVNQTRNSSSNILNHIQINHANFDQRQQKALENYEKSKQNVLDNAQSTRALKLDCEKIDLWNITKQQKATLLAQIRGLNNKQNYTPFLRSKDEQIQQFFAQYENRSSVINWTEVTGKEELLQQILTTLTKLNTKYNIQQSRLHAIYNKSVGYMGEYNKGITFDQFFTALKRKRLLMNHLNSTANHELEQQQRNFYQRKYHISQYQQLPICIVMPTYNNLKDLRYVWSIQSILQQQYSNFKIVIIDDGSKDRTAQLTARYLKWRNADPSKYILVASRQHRGALQNIYYGAHKYCDYNQIFFIIDGDDELIGRQVFKVFNAVYQKEKHYVLYTQFLSYDPKSNKRLDIGISEDFPTFVKKRNSYRTFKHSYSQLRSMISDLILLERVSSLKLKNGRFFGLLYDNALFYPAFEMSCEKVSYLPQIFYWYNMNTGSNDWRQAKTAYYRENRFGIELQKPYRCIDNQLNKILKVKVNNG